jgi:hypothetical protein
MNVDENLAAADYNQPLTAEPTPPPVPTHLYAVRDGDRYGYVAAVSEDDQKRGKAAGDVVFFVYRGREGDTYKMDVVTPAGEIVEDDECQRPCKAIKRYQWGGIGYIGFEPNSLIGEAYTDAFNGFLVPSPLRKQAARSPGDQLFTVATPQQTSPQAADPENSTDWSPPGSDPVVNQ